MLLLSKIGDTKEVVLVEIAYFAFLQAAENKMVFYFLGAFQNSLNRQVLQAKIFIFHVLQALDEALLLHLSYSQIFLQRLEYSYGDSNSCEKTLDNDKIEDLFEVGVGEGIGKEGDEPLKNPHFVREGRLLEDLVCIWVRQLQDFPKEFAVEPAKRKVVFEKTQQHEIWVGAECDQAFQSLFLRKSGKQEQACDKVQSLGVPNFGEFQRKSFQDVAKGLFHLGLVEFRDVRVGAVDVLIDLKEDGVEGSGFGIYLDGVQLEAFDPNDSIVGRTKLFLLFYLGPNAAHL